MNWARVSRAHRIGERDGWTCWLCGHRVDPDAPLSSPSRATIDHVIPRSRGGSSAVENLRLAHRSCNARRSNELPELSWPGSFHLVDSGDLWQSLARLAPRPASEEVIALALTVELGREAARWAIERAEQLVPGGWSAWVEERDGPCRVFLSRPTESAASWAGRPKVTDVRRSRRGRGS
ncbi:MAG: HNH endonuclease [Acidimicrobiia bacterium]